MKRKCAIILIATLVMQLLFCDFGVYKKTVKSLRTVYFTQLLFSNSPSRNSGAM